MPRHRMNRRLADLLGFEQFPWLLSIDPEPSDFSDDGGGEDDSTEDHPNDFKGALKNERAMNKALRAELAQFKAQLDSVKDINPETYKESQRKAEELQRQLLEREQLTEVERKRIETKAQEQVRKANEQAQTEKAKRIDLQVRTLARSVFSAAEGRDGADNSGLSFFDAWMEFQGRRHLRVDETTGKLYVLDSDGDRIKTAEGQDIDPVAWLNQQADNSPVVGTFFKPKGGEGSGGFVGARGVRGTQIRSVDDMRKATPSMLLEEHYAS